MQEGKLVAGRQVEVKRQRSGVIKLDIWRVKYRKKLRKRLGEETKQH